MEISKLQNLLFYMSFIFSGCLALVCMLLGSGPFVGMMLLLIVMIVMQIVSRIGNEKGILSNLTDLSVIVIQVILLYGVICFLVFLVSRVCVNDIQSKMKVFDLLVYEFESCVRVTAFFTALIGICGIIKK